MSGRKLGGGRILGTGKGLAPPATTTTGPAASARRATSPLTQGESLASLSLGGAGGGSGSTSPASGSVTDLMANMSLEPVRGADVEERLVCPICEEEMVTLLQLNRHIDDVHQELTEDRQDEVKTWFDKQVLKAKKFQPLSLINQKLRGLETFESNESLPSTSYSVDKSAASTASAAAAAAESIVDPDDLITKKHWQRPRGNDLCTDPTCGKSLGAINGSINCRGCGRLFCEEHTMYQMKLSRQARHDPHAGFWARVCETCYVSRAGYSDHEGVSTSHTDEFVRLRSRTVERHNLETSRLEKRLTKLTRLLVDPPPVGAEPGANNASSLLSSPVASLTGQKSARKAIEQTVVVWEEDATVEKCRFCQQVFGSWTFRRHHCRICGRVVCADLETRCSTEVALNVANPASARQSQSQSEKPNGAPNHLIVDVRMCRDCNHTIFSKRDFVASRSIKPPDQRAYETLRQFERGIRHLMPSFQKALLALQVDEDSDTSRPPPTEAQLKEASKIRKRLVDSFGKYGETARRIRDLPTGSKTQMLLQKAIYESASAFLHVHMLPLKSVPQMLRARTSSSTGSGHSSLHRHLLHANNSSSSISSPLRNGEVAQGPSDANSQTSDASSTVVSALETEERELRERLMVLEEQRFNLAAMAREARGKRRFDEVGPLTRSMEELDGEIARLRGMVGGVEERWAQVYEGSVQGG